MEKMSVTTIKIIADLLTKCDNAEAKKKLVKMAFDIADKEKRGGEQAV